MRQLIINIINSLVAIVTLAMYLPVHATEELDAIKISGSAIKAYSPYDFIGAHQSIDSEEFNRSFHTLSSILEQQSGIEIQSIGGIGQYSSPVIRGSSGQQVLVFWDGMLINNLSGGGADIGNLNLSLATNIDVYRSIAPAELSASAVGGVIHIQSEDLSSSEGKLLGKATAVYGSYNTQQYSLLQHFNIGRSQWLIAADHLSADNDFEYIQLGAQGNENTPTIVPRYNNGSYQYHTLLKGLQKYENGRVDTAFQFGKSDRELSTIINSPTAIPEFSTKDTGAQIRWNHIWSELHKTEFISALTTQSQLYDDRYSKIGLGAQLNEYKTLGKRFQWNHYIEHDKISSLISAKYHKEETNSKYKLLTEEELTKQCNSGRGCNTEYQRLQSDFSSRLQYQDNDNKIILQISHISLEDKNLTSLNSQKEFTGTTWSTGVEHRFLLGVNTYVNIANQVRLPSTNELFGDRGLTIGNADLLPETAEHFEFGLTYQNEIVDYKASTYIRNVKEAIIGESGNQGVIHYSNLGKTRHIGIEQNISWVPFNPLLIIVNLTLQNNEIIEDKRFSYYEGKQVAGYSQFYSFASIQWSQEYWDLKVSNTLELDGFYSNSNLEPKDDKNRWDASIGFNLKQWRISIDGHDLTNNSAKDYPLNPEPGRSYFLRAQTEW